MIKTTDYIYTHSGRKVLPYNPNPDHIVLEDITYGLAGINRFNGQTRLSVLRHSIALCLWVRDSMPKAIEAQHYALFHDASEAYLMDVPVPLKMYVNSEWAEAVRLFDQIIFEKFIGCKQPVGKMLVDDMDKMLVSYEMDSRAYTNERYSKMKYPGPRRHTMSVDQYYLWGMSEPYLVDEFTRMHADLSLLAGVVPS